MGPSIRHRNPQLLAPSRVFSAGFYSIQRRTIEPRMLGRCRYLESQLEATEDVFLSSVGIVIYVSVANLVAPRQS